MGMLDPLGNMTTPSFAGRGSGFMSAGTCTLHIYMIYHTVFTSWRLIGGQGASNDICAGIGEAYLWSLL